MTTGFNTTMLFCQPRNHPKRILRYLHLWLSYSGLSLFAAPHQVRFLSEPATEIPCMSERRQETFYFKIEAEDVETHSPNASQLFRVYMLFRKHSTDVQLLIGQRPRQLPSAADEQDCQSEATCHGPDKHISQEVQITSMKC